MIAAIEYRKDNPAASLYEYRTEDESVRVAQKSTAAADGLRRILKGTFLPAGYPDSVREEYIEYQLWDTLQGLCSYLRGVLCTAAVLEAAGVGKQDASAIAAAIVWVMRDGFGLVGSLIFSFCVGGGMDSHIKEWRLFADLINNVGLFLDMLCALPRFQSNYAQVAALSALCKGLCGVAASCAKGGITAHFGVAQNIADVSAKENAQETAVTLLGMFIGVQLTGFLGSGERSAWGTFLFLTGVHIFANIRAVSVLQLRTLNYERTMILLNAYVYAERENIKRMSGLLSPAAISKQESLVAPLYAYIKRCGCSTGRGVRLRDACKGNANTLKWLIETYTDEEYLLMQFDVGIPQIVLSPRASPRDQIQALLQSYLMADKLTEPAPGTSRLAYDISTFTDRVVLNLMADKSTNPAPSTSKLTPDASKFTDELVLSLGNARRLVDGFMRTVDAEGWDIHHVHLGYGDWRCDWHLKKAK